MRQETGGATACVGVVEHANRAVLVTVSADGVLLDRRHLALTDAELPTHPHHHEGSWAVGRYRHTAGARVLPLADVVALVARVREAAEEGARLGLEALAHAVPVPIRIIAIRHCPALPPTIEACIADHRAQTFADSVMYRQALASAAVSRGWAVHWYDRDRVRAEAAALPQWRDVDALVRTMGRAAGVPWRQEHRLAALAALAASGDGRSGHGDPDATLRPLDRGARP